MGAPSVHFFRPRAAVALGTSPAGLPPVLSLYAIADSRWAVQFWLWFDRECYRQSTMSSDDAASCECPPEPEAPDLRPIEGDVADAELADAAKALGHPARVKIVRLLARRGRCQCGEIVEELPLAQSTVSQHLKVLKDAGLIRGEIDGPRVCYCLSERAIRRLRALVAAL